MIEILNIKKTFGKKIVIENLSFSIKTGEIYGLLGPNGAGKTTIINILCNLLNPDSGAVKIHGNNLDDKSKSLIGVVPQEISFYKDLTCKENLDFFARLNCIQNPERKRKINELIQIFNLGEYINTETHKLSGGWSRRVNIAIALVHSPDILILDEPTAGLDIEARFNLWETIKKLNQMGVTILLTTHQFDEAERLCSWVGILNNGKLQAEGSIENLRGTIPAKQIAFLESEDDKAVLEKSALFGWQHRYYGEQLAIWLPEIFALKDFILKFDGVPMSSISLHNVGLEHVYLEVMREETDKAF